MYQLYQTTQGSRGSLAEVWINEAAGLVKKHYKPRGITIRGTPPLHQSLEEIRALFENEIYWSTKLKSDLVLDIYEYGELPDEPGYYILQPYHNPDLLHFYDKNGLDRSIPNPSAQLREMFAFFKMHNVYKFNNAMCNLTHCDGRIMAFDFKYADHRSSEMRSRELHGIKTWLSKIDSSIPKILDDLI